MKGSVGILKRSVGILKGSVGILKGSIGILKSSVGILKGSVGILIHWHYEHWYFEHWYFEPPRHDLPAAWLRLLSERPCAEDKHHQHPGLQTVKDCRLFVRVPWVGK